jgi:hypothetical protein
VRESSSASALVATTSRKRRAMIKRMQAVSHFIALSLA